MLRILRRFGRKIFFFKRISIGIKLLRSSFKSITFQHYKYFIFCFIITFVQLSRITLFSYIDPRISKTILITEFLSGESFFEILIDYLKFPVTGYDLKLIFVKNVLFLIELTTLYFTNITLSFYVYHKNLTITECFKKTITRSKVAFSWVIIEILVLFITALLGFIGNILQFIWQLSTALSVQIIAFEKKNIFEILKSTFIYFKKTFDNILGIDLIIDFMLVILSAVFYYIYKTSVVPTFNFLNAEKEINLFIITLAFYILSTIQVLEVITFTKLYKLFHSHIKN